MAIYKYTDNSATISTTEFSLPKNSAYSAGSGMNNVGFVQVLVDLSNLTASETYVLRVYEAVGGGSQRLYYEATVGFAQAEGFVTPLLMLGNNWDVTMTKVAGTDRTILWSVRQNQQDVMAEVIEGSMSMTQVMRVVLAALAGKADGFSGATQHYRDTADTKNRITAAVDATGRTAVTLDVS